MVRVLKRKLEQGEGTGGGWVGLLFYTGLSGKVTGDVKLVHAQRKSIPDRGNNNCKGPKAGVSSECSGNSQEASYLTLPIAMRASYH